MRSFQVNNSHFTLALRKMDEAGDAYRKALDGVELSTRKRNAISAAEDTLNYARWNLLCLVADSEKE